MKLLIPGLLLAAAIAAVVWVLAPPSTPAPVPREPGTAAARADTAPRDTAGERDGPAPADPARGADAERKAKGAEALAAARAQVAAAQAASAQANPGSAAGAGLGAIAAAGLEPDEQPARQVGESKWGRQGRPPARVELKAVQDSVRAYYGNLPKLGEVPATVRLEELFPAGVIDDLNLPPGGRVVELGPFPIADRQAFTHLLGPEDSAPSAVGVTVITPDGERVREYLFFPQPGD